jgi:hypothetical protein
MVDACFIFNLFLLYSPRDYRFMCTLVIESSVACSARGVTYVRESVRLPQLKSPVHLLHTIARNSPTYLTVLVSYVHLHRNIISLTVHRIAALTTCKSVFAGACCVALSRCQSAHI